MSDLTKQSELKNCTETPMSDHVAQFWRLLETETVHLSVNIRQVIGHDFPDEPTVYYDCSTFSNDVAKALVKERNTRPASAGVREALEESRHWHYRQDKALSKSGRSDADYYWRRDQHRQEIERIDSALSDHGVQKSAAGAITKSDGGKSSTRTAGGFPVAAAPSQAEETGVILPTREWAGIERRDGSDVTAGETAPICPRCDKPLEIIHACWHCDDCAESFGFASPGPSDSLLSKTLTEGEQKRPQIESSPANEGSQPSRTTDADLLALIDRARNHVMTPNEQYEQRRSFLRGMCPSHRDYADWCAQVDKHVPPLDAETRRTDSSECSPPAVFPDPTPEHSDEG